MCAVDAMGCICNTVRDRPTAVEQHMEEVVCRLQVCLPYVTVGACGALPPVSAQLATRGNPHSPLVRSPVTQHAREFVRRWVQDLTVGAELR